MRAIVVDDEYLALQSMARNLQRYEVDVVGVFQDPREALKQHLALSADVAFVDIEMPEMGGLDLATRLQSDNPELHIVFVTAYEQYAIDAFELAAVDYLLKPVQLKRLDMTLKRLSAIQSAHREPGKDSFATLCLLHHLSIQDAKGTSIEIQWRTNKAKELFAYMIHLGERTPNKDELLDRLWPDGDMDKAATYLHTTIYQIRRTLRNANIPMNIEYKDGRYRLDIPSEVTVDAMIWERSLKEAADAVNREEEYRLLLNGYRGDYLETEGFLWAEIERERLRAFWLEHALRNAEWMEAAAFYGNAISLYQQIQLKFPEIETSYFGLMRLFDKLGNSLEVYNQYEKLTRILAEEFAIKPSEKTSAWFDNWNGGSRTS